MTTVTLDPGAFALTRSGHVGVIRLAPARACNRYELHALPGVPEKDYFSVAPIGLEGVVTFPQTKFEYAVTTEVVAVLDAMSVFNYMLRFAKYLPINQHRIDVAMAPPLDNGQPETTLAHWVENGSSHYPAFDHVCNEMRVPWNYRAILAYMILRVKLSPEVGDH